MAEMEPQRADRESVLAFPAEEHPGHHGNPPLELSHLHQIRGRLRQNALDKGKQALEIRGFTRNPMHLNELTVGTLRVVAGHRVFGNRPDRDPPLE
mgnify:CR=1 FL=1